MIVNIQIQLVISLFRKFELAERYVSDSNIKEIIRELSFFKSRYLNIGSLIKLLCNLSGYTVKLNTVQSAVTHFIRHHTKEVADTHCRFKYVSFLKAEIFKTFVNC